MAFVAPFIPLIATTLTVGSAVVQTVGSIQAQKHASKAADVEAKYREDLLARKSTDERNVLRENSTRRLRERQRRMAEIRAEQAARGFADSGTPLAVFGEIESILDDQINQATNQGLDQISQYNEQIKMSRFSSANRREAESLNMFNTVLGGDTQLGSNLYGAHKEFGTKGDPFSIFKIK